MSQTEKKNSLWRSGNLLKTTVTLSARATFVRHLVALTGGHRHVTLRNIRHNHRHTNNIDADYGNIMMMLTLVDSLKMKLNLNQEGSSSFKIDQEKENSGINNDNDDNDKMNEFLKMICSQVRETIQNQKHSIDKSLQCVLLRRKI